MVGYKKNAQYWEQRWRTERPVTSRGHGGISGLVGNNIERIHMEFFETLIQDRKPERPKFWNGKMNQQKGD